jgi:hypothetical protein
MLLILKFGARRLGWADEDIVGLQVAHAVILAIYFCDFVIGPKVLDKLP